jgi:hypothetical protein
VVKQVTASLMDEVEDDDAERAKAESVDGAMIGSVPESSLPLTGGCNCGAVRFELTETPVRAGYCHCTRCQRRTGTAASSSAIANSGTFRIVSGEDHVRRWNAGDGADKAFCGTCGSALFGQHPESPEFINVRMGSFDSDPGVRPMGRLHVASAAVWEPIPDDGLPRLPGPLEA